MALRKIHNVYYIYFRDVDGTQRTRSLKTTDKEIAKRLHDGYMKQLQSKKGEMVIMRDFPEHFPKQAPIRSIAPPVTTDNGHTKGSIALDKMWDIALKKRPLSKMHSIYWGAFLKRIGVKYADQVTPAVALDYMETHYSSGNGKSYNTAKSALNVIFRCCLVEAKLTTSPFEPIINRRITETASRRNLTLAEVDAIMATAPLHIQIMTMLSRWTAQRLETCARITPEMFDLERRVIIIDPGKTKRFNKWVCCPIFPELESFMLPLLAKCKPGLPIVRNFNYPSSNAIFSHQFCQLLARLQITATSSGNVGFHSLRGTAITWFKENGITGETLRSITGHASQEVEDIYARAISNISQIATNWPSKKM